jgi:hypothetical protein
MKLNPPASSSDLELAREIAQRLHQPAVPPRRPAPRAPQHAAPPSPLRTSPPPPPHPAPPAPESAAPPPLQHIAPPPPPRPTPPPLPPRPQERAEPPSAPLEPAPAWDEAPPPPPADDLEIEVPPAAPEEAAVTDEELSLGEEGPSFGNEEDDLSVPPPPIDLEVAGSDTSPEVRQPAVEEPSPFDDDLPEPPETAPEDLFAEPAPPSWDDVIEACFELSQASGAMLVDPAGQVFAARGDWPDPGAEAIAAKLVPMLDRTLKDAPTRSVSAPVAGRHLTAWRVPLAEGLVTVAFVGQSPLRADLRPAIDEQIHRGAGA